MSANVRCAGHTRMQNRSLLIVKSACGWKGDRPGRPTKVDGEIHWNILTIPNDPCPRCGGRVELIPTDGAP